MLTIDGSYGEGGGQILRTALSLSLVTRTPVRIENLRAGRAKPGLMRQHLTALRAAAEVGQAAVHGGEIGSQAVELHPREVVPGEYRFNVGSAGSATLVFQTVLPALLRAAAPSVLVLEGGTHNPLAPTFDYLARVFLPLLAKMGVRCAAKLERPGFYPAGGGRFEVRIEPTTTLTPLHLVERGDIRTRRATAMFAGLPFDVARRELATLRARLGWEEAWCRPLEVHAAGNGNVVQVEVESEHVTEMFTGFGERGLSAETVAARVADEVSEYLDAGVPVGPHLADQLLLPMALAGGGSFRSLAPTLHSKTQMTIVERFVKTRVRCEAITDEVWHYEVST